MKTKMRIITVFSLALIFALGCSQTKQSKEPATADYAIQGVPFNKVKVDDNFWLPKIETNRTVTIPASFAKCEEMGRMDNFLMPEEKWKAQLKGKCLLMIPMFIK